MDSIRSLFTRPSRKFNSHGTSPPITRELLLQQAKRNAEIERELRQDRARLRRQHVILLLGTGESGKSTFLKQLRIINGKRFTQAELDHYRSVIFDNIYKGLLFLIHALENFGLSWVGGSESEAAQAAQRLEQHFAANRTIQRDRARSNQALFTEAEFLALAPDFRAVWRDANIRKAFDQRAKLITEKFSENTRYYLDRLDQIAVENYTPTDDEIVWSREATENIVEQEFIVHHVPLVFVDVGGQTKERRKWCQCFTGMSSAAFLIAGSQYDEFYEDRATGELRNKLQEAMCIFQGLINHKAFCQVAVMIFFNKTDILTEKVTVLRSDIRNTFPDFPDKFNPFELNDVKSFFTETFGKLARYSSSDQNGMSFRLGERPASVSRLSRQHSQHAPQRTLYRHFTTAVERGNIEKMFSAIEDHVLRMNIHQLEMKLA